MTLFTSFMIQTAAALIGIFAGTLLALAIDRRNERRRQSRRANIILRSLQKELADNYKALQRVRPAYRKTAFGKSFYVNSRAWETAVGTGDLPDIIGFQLTDVIGEQYATLARVRYYLNLMTQLWMAPRELEGYNDMQAGFHRHIQKAMDEAINRHNSVLTAIGRALR